MTINEMMILYLAFALSGAVTMIWIIYVPAVQIIRRLQPEHPLLWPTATLLGGFIMFVIFLLSGPMMLFVLARRDSFLQSFLKGLLNNED